MPNVSHCKDVNDMHYNPLKFLIVKYEVSDISTPTSLYYYYANEGQEDYWMRGIDFFNVIIIDGNIVSIDEIDASEGKYQFSKNGEHTIKYALKNPLLLSDSTFKYCTDITSVEIPDNVKTIDTFAFYNCSNLTNVSIANSVTSIGVRTFSGCIKLVNIVIPDSVTSIGDRCFESCRLLNNVTISNNLSSVNYGLFSNCENLESITIPNSVTNIGSQVFINCTKLTSVTLGSHVTTIGSAAFMRCTGLTSIEMPNSVTTIGGSSFYECTSLSNIRIGNNVNEIGNHSFTNCTSLNSITCLATTAPTIYQYTFNNVKSNGTLTVPNGSTGYDVWMGTGNYYLGKYGWTKVEQ